MGLGIKLYPTQTGLGCRVVSGGVVGVVVGVVVWGRGGLVSFLVRYGYPLVTIYRAITDKSKPETSLFR